MYDEFKNISYLCIYMIYINSCLQPAGLQYKLRLKTKKKMYFIKLGKINYLKISQFLKYNLLINFFIKHV